MEATTSLECIKTKLQTGTELTIKITFKDNANPDYIRVSTKASCYRILTTDLKGKQFTVQYHQRHRIPVKDSGY